MIKRLKFKRSHLLKIGPLVFLGLILPLSSVKSAGFLAAIGSMLLGKLSMFAGAIGSLIAKVCIFTWVSQAAFRFALGFLGWVTSPEFLAGVSYTRNPFVTSGWLIVRDFCNMFYILIVIAIGIGTALRIREYQIQKLIPKLIVSAILINFTPLICGLIIDGANVFINFFLASGTEGLGKIVVESISSFGQLIGRMFHFGTSLLGGQFGKAGDLLFDSFVTIIFNFYGTFTVLALALLFAIRYLALWTAVILAPLAFLCWILPHSSIQRVWRMWWQQFLSWCFVGIGGAFFLYLAQLMEGQIDSLITSPGATLGLSTQGLSGMLVHLFPLTFLLIGYTLTFQYAPMGASAVLGIVKMAQGYVAGKIIGRYGKPEWQKWRKLARRPPMPARISQKLEQWKGAKPESLERVPRGLKRIAAWGLRSTATIGEKILGPSRGGINEEDKGYKEAKENDLLTNLTLLTKAIQEMNRARAAGIVRAMAEKGQLLDAMKKEKVGAAAITQKELLDAYTRLKQMDYYFGTKKAEQIEKSLSHSKEMMNRFAQITHELIPKEKRGSIVGLTKEDEAKGITSFLEKIWRSLKTKEDFERVDFNEIQKDEELLDKFTKTMLLNPQQLAEAGRTLGKSFVDAAQEKAEEVGASWFYELDEKTGKARAPGTLRYLTTTGALALGYAPIPGAATREEMKGFEVEARHWETALRRAKTEDEIEALQKELEEAERESANEEIKRIILSARKAAEVKLQRLKVPPEEAEVKKRRKRPEAGEWIELPPRPPSGPKEAPERQLEERRRPEAGEE